MELIKFTPRTNKAVLTNTDRYNLGINCISGTKIVYLDSYYCIEAGYNLEFKSNADINILICALQKLKLIKQG